MTFHKCEVNGAFRIELKEFSDDRGSFTRIWCKDTFREHGIEVEMLQANAGRSIYKHTLRGLHYQLKPYAEAKLVRCTRGAAWDVCLDLRRDSDTFGVWSGFELSEDKAELFYIPPGCAHGYLTLMEDTELFYMVSNIYKPEAERGVRWDDPAFEIDWKGVRDPIISEKDKIWPNYSI